MPKLHLTTKEAKSLAAKRKRDKAHNTAILAAVETIKRRLKDADPLATDTLHKVLGDLRRMVR